MKQKLFSLALCIAVLFFSKNSAYPFVDKNFKKFVKENFASSNDEIIDDDKGLFIVLCPNPELGKKILQEENKLYFRFLKIFKSLTVWKNPTIIKICYDRSEYESKFQLFGTAGFMTKSKKNSITFRLVASWIQDDLLDNILPHETAHLFVADLAKVDKINSSKGKPILPLWVNEGIAQFFEKDKSFLIFKIYLMQIALHENGQIPFDKFFSYTKYPENTYYFYIQSEVIVRFLLSQPNGYNHIRNYITIFRSKVKDGYKAFQLSFKEFYDMENLRKEFLSWCIKNLKGKKTNIKKINEFCAKIADVKKFNDKLYKEVALSMIAYQHYLNKNYKKALNLAEKSVALHNNYFLSYNTYIKSLYKLNMNKKAQLMIEQYKTIDKSQAFNLLAEIARENKNYKEEVKYLKILLNIDKANGYFYCMRLAYIYSEYFGDYETARSYYALAKTYIQPVDQFY